MTRAFGPTPGSESKLTDNEENKEVRIDCVVEIEGNWSRISCQRVAYWVPFKALRLPRIEERVERKNEGCDREVGRVGGNTPTFTSLPSKYVAEDTISAIHQSCTSIRDIPLLTTVWRRDRE